MSAPELLSLPRKEQHVPRNRTEFYGQSFISIDQIKSPQQIQQIFSLADLMKQIVEGRIVYRPLEGFYIVTLFYQPSTRTSSSFEAAAKRLGADTAVRDGMEHYSSVTKGENLADTIRTIIQTTGSDLIILRHPEDKSGEVAARFAGLSSVPVINAGSGIIEHPTQALLDLYTIQRLLGKTNGLKVLMVGDLLYGRTIKSLTKLLALMGEGTEVIFASPPELRAPHEFLASLSGGINLREVDNVSEDLATADVVYWTRIQKEWFVAHGQMDTYERIKDQFILTPEMVRQMRQDAIIMHPLPRVNEIMPEVDNDPRAAYFAQMRSGLYVRMALLHEILLGHDIVS